MNGQIDQGGHSSEPSRCGSIRFDRVTGQPVWPIEERPVQQSDVPGEKSAKTQPFPTKPRHMLAMRSKFLTI